MQHKTYRGTRLDPDAKTAGDVRVTVDDHRGTRPLDPKPSQRLRNHSPDGFNWGYGGSGPAQLALAILLDYFGAARRQWITTVYQDFKFSVVASWPQDGDWQITGAEIDAWAALHAPTAA